jgi:hypothetical protein
MLCFAHSTPAISVIFGSSHYAEPSETKFLFARMHSALLCV